MKHEPEPSSVQTLHSVIDYHLYKLRPDEKVFPDGEVSFAQK